MGKKCKKDRWQLQLQAAVSSEAHFRKELVWTSWRWKDTLGIQWLWCRYKTCLAQPCKPGENEAPQQQLYVVHLELCTYFQWCKLWLPSLGPLCILEIMQSIHMDAWTAPISYHGFPPVGPSYHCLLQFMLPLQQVMPCLGPLHPSWPGMCNAKDADICTESTSPLAEAAAASSAKAVWSSGAFRCIEATPKPRAF